MVLFIDGQKIAKKLCSSISKETKVAQRLLEEYNEATCELSCADQISGFKATRRCQIQVFLGKLGKRLSKLF